MFILYFGHVNIDTVLNVRELTRRGESREVLRYEERVGGTAYNAYKSLINLGVPSKIFSVIGEDLNEKLDGYFVVGIKNPKCWIISAENEQKAYVYQGEWRYEKKLNIEYDELGNFQWLHLSTGNPRFYRKIAREGKKRGRKIGFDPSQEIHYLYDEKIFREIFSFADIFFCNQKEFNKAIEFVGDEIYNKRIIKTMGKEGVSLFLPEKGWKNFRAYPSRVVNTIGAGDSFRAGFYAGLYRNMSIEESVKLGIAVSSFVVESEESYYTRSFEDALKRKINID